MNAIEKLCSLPQTKALVIIFYLYKRQLGGGGGGEGEGGKPTSYSAVWKIRTFSFVDEIAVHSI